MIQYLYLLWNDHYSKYLTSVTIVIEFFCDENFKDLLS